MNENLEEDVMIPAVLNILNESFCNKRLDRFGIEKGINLDGMGIYAISNTLNKRIYIGSTNYFRERIKKHKGLLNKNNHFNQYLQNDWKKDQTVEFIFLVLEYMNDENKLLEIEQKWIDLYFDHQKQCYNILEIAGNPGKFKKSPEQLKAIKEKIIESTGKRVYKFSLNGEYIEVFRTIADARKITNAGSISLCIGNKILSSDGFLWSDNPNDGKEKSLRYFEQLKIEEKRKYNQYENLSEDKKQGIINAVKKSLGKPVYKFDLNGNFIEKFESYSEAFRQTKAHGIWDVLRGKYTQSKGYIWSYSQNDGKEKSELYKQNKINLSEKRSKFFKENNPNRKNK